MPTTPIYQLPYPAAADPADVPVDMQELAERIELVFPGRELAYAQITASVAVTATTEAAANAVVSAPATTFDGAAVIVEFFAAHVALPPVAVGGLSVWLTQNGTSIGLLSRMINPAAASMGTVVLARRKLTPTAASHTFAITASVSSGSGSIAAGPGGVGLFMPAFIRIVRA